MSNLARLPNIRVVLSHPSHPGNIGSAARAMKTMGLSELVLVNPKLFPHAEAEALASGAVDLLARTRVVASLPEALAGCRLAIALSARRRELTVPLLNTRQAASQLLAEAAQGPVALVFGNETYGLSNDEVLCCQALVSIDANPEYSSLNLAQAVQVLAYELRQQAQGEALPEGEPLERAAVDDLERFYGHLEHTLIHLGFLNPIRPRRLMPRLRRLFGRSGLERKEVDILRGILRAIEARCSPADKPRN